MRLTQVLKKQHLDFMFKKHWLVQGQRVPIDSGLEDHLKSLNIPVVDANEFVKRKPEERELVHVVGAYEVPLPLDENHPDYKERPCFTLKDNNVLLEGISQAQVLTKTIIAADKLPDNVEELAELDVPSMVHDCVKKAILSANVFDCEQQKLKKKKDPARPAYNFPRILGITDKRRNVILTNKLLQLIEKSSDSDTTMSKYVVNDVNSRATVEKEEDLLQFQETSHILVTADKPLKHNVPHGDKQFIDIPNLYPIKHTVTMPPEHFYEENSEYPIRSAVNKRHPHTTWLHFNRSQVANLFEEEVTNEQELGRSLTNAFTVAAAYAKELHGDNVKDLPEPIYINSIQTDGQLFHFGVLELKTLDLEGAEGTKNVWYSKNNMKLYESSRYFSGMPVLEKYNPHVYGYINAFYNS